MNPDCRLLRQYAVDGDDAAFTEVVRRHVNLVYASAVRLLNGNATMAQDVTQVVFTDLARKAGGLTQHTSVAGWLHTSVRFAAANAVRSEQRRRLREQEASAMSDHHTHNAHEIVWSQLRPLIDEAVAQLREPERGAVLLRFFEEKSHREVGAALGLSENAARMRVERGLEKLRAHLARHGITASVILLAATLSAHAASAPVPVGLATVIAGKALLDNTLVVGGAGLAKAAQGTIWNAKVQVILVGAATLASAVAAAFIFNPANSHPVPSTRYTPANRDSAPMIAPADVLAEVQARESDIPGVLAAAAAAAHSATIATTSATAGFRLLQSLPPVPKLTVVRNSDSVPPAGNTPVPDSPAPIADNATPAAADEPGPDAVPPPSPVAPVAAAASAPPTPAAPGNFGKLTQWRFGLGGNGHYYLAVAMPGGITWPEAQRYAVLRGGHLATIATREENDFVFGLVDAPQFWRMTANKQALLGPWLGGVHGQYATDMTYGWQWINNGGTITFTNWAFQEPRTSGNRLHFFALGSQPRPTWNNDFAQGLMPALVVEFDTKPGVVSSMAATSGAQSSGQSSAPILPQATLPPIPFSQRQTVVQPAAPLFGPSPRRVNAPIVFPRYQPLAVATPFARTAP